MIAATNKWSEFRPSIRDLLGTRFELRLGDPYESEMGRALADERAGALPGRGLTRDGHALPDRAAADRRAAVHDGLPDAVRKLVETVDVAWHGPARPRGAHAA